MARDFSTRTDTDKTDLAKYPDGRIKDGITDGTKAGEEVVGDFQQVFLKAMRDAGITPNRLPDNEINGWQMFDAMKIAMTGQSDWEEITSFDGNSTQNAFPTEDNLMVRLNGGYVEIFGVYFQGTTGNGFNVPAKYVPAKTKSRMIRADIGTGEISMSIIGGNANVYLNGGISSQSVYVNGRYKLD